MRSLRGVSWWPLVVLWVPFAVLARHFWFLCDDAYITFRYAKNFARADGITYNVGEAPVEGYSNFLWLLISAGFESILYDPAFWMPLISFGIGSVFVFFFYWTLRHHLELERAPALLAALVVGCCPPFALWTTSGLATMPFAFLIFVLFERLVLARGPNVWITASIVGILLILTRIEGIAWVGVITVLAVPARLLDDDRRDIRAAVMPVAKSLVLIAAAYGLYSLWRYNYFGYWLPNTVAAKVGFTEHRAARGLKYLLLHWATFFPHVFFFFGAPMAIRWRFGAGTAIVLMAVAFPMYVVAVGGDFMPMGRMILPGIPFGAALVGFLLQDMVDRGERLKLPSWLWPSSYAGHRRAMVLVGLNFVFLGALPAMDWHYVPEKWRTALHFRLSDKTFLSEYNRWLNMVGNTHGFMLRGKALKEMVDPEATVVSRAIGVAGYYSELFIYDQYGLVNREVALLPSPEGPLTESPGHDKAVKPDFFMKYDPDYLYTRLVQGEFSARLMNASLEAWDVSEDARKKYVPDFWEVEIEGEVDPCFLLVVRKVRKNENAGKMWSDFKNRRQALWSRLNKQYAEARGEEPGQPPEEEFE